jgi:hypothetical protein
VRRRQQVMDARTAVAPVVAREEARDGGEEHLVLFRMGAARAATPSIEPSARDPVAPTEARHADRGALGVEVGERFGLRAEQNRMAFWGGRAPPVAARARARGLGAAATPGTDPPGRGAGGARG